MTCDCSPSAVLDLWINGGSSICSQLNKEVLRNIKEVFTDLQTQVKLKLLLSFFHIPRRLIDEVGWTKLWLVSDGTHSKFTNTSKGFCVCSHGEHQHRFAVASSSANSLSHKFLLEIHVVLVEDGVG
jgi:hypothetical protein